MCEAGHTSEGSKLFSLFWVGHTGSIDIVGYVDLEEFLYSQGFNF